MIAITGTSIEAFSDSYPPIVAARLGQPIENYGLGGGTFQFPNADGKTIRTEIDRAISEHASDPGPKHMHIGGPFNDLMSTDIADIGNLNWAVHHADDALIAAGWTVSAGAILPFHGGGAFPEDYYPALLDRKKAYNSWGAAHFSDRWIDLYWNLRETRDYDRADYRFFKDGLHLDQYGALLAGNAFPLAVLTPGGTT